MFGLLWGADHPIGGASTSDAMRTPICLIVFTQLIGSLSHRGYSLANCAVWTQTASQRSHVKHSHRANRPLTWHEQEQLFRWYSTRVDNYLDAGHGAVWLKQPAIADLVASALKFHESLRFMVGEDHRAENLEGGGAHFATTHWSVVLAAGGADAPEATAALERLCQTYWYPLYAYLRRTGHNPQDAEDLVQGFFLHLLRRQILKSVQRAGGRFRSFLLGTLKHFLAHETERAAAQKRGGARQSIAWDPAQAEEQFLREPVDIESPDRLFERRWAVVVLEQGLKNSRCSMLNGQ